MWCLSEPVIVTSTKLTFAKDNRKSSIQELPDIQVITDSPAKAMEIGMVIGHRPIFACSSSNVDIAVLQLATGGDQKGLGSFNHHGSLHEYAYDRGISVEEMDKGLDVARDLGWQVVSMKNDWRVIF
jgi:hypothetical protein